MCRKQQLRIEAIERSNEGGGHPASISGLAGSFVSGLAGSFVSGHAGSFVSGLVVTLLTKRSAAPACIGGSEATACIGGSETRRSSSGAQPTWRPRTHAIKA